MAGRDSAEEMKDATGVLRPFDKLMVVSIVEPQSQDGEHSRTINP